MRIKDYTVKFVGIKPKLLETFHIVEEIYQFYGEEAVITSLNDGNHMTNSKHYSGEAMDLRTRFWDETTIELVANELRLKLGKDYDVVVESHHIHLEFDKK